MAEDFGGKAEGGLKKRIGPLEVWQWGAATLGVVFAYLAYKQHAANSTSGAPASVGATNTALPGTGGQPTDIGTTISGQLTDLTGQVGALQQSVAGLAPGGGTPSTNQSGFSADITNLYGLTGRTPDVGGAAYWQSVVNTQGVGQAVNQFAATPEAQGFAASNPAGFVSAEYQTELGRTPDAAGLAYWQGQLQTLGAAKEAQAFTTTVQTGAK